MCCNCTDLVPFNTASGPFNFLTADPLTTLKNALSLEDKY